MTKTELLVVMLQIQYKYSSSIIKMRFSVLLLLQVEALLCLFDNGGRYSSNTQSLGTKLMYLF